ncbi:MAG: tRNA (guanine(10)-N(2))-dimethyltransferase [Candidatus Altiarchaeales archaeon ex4484_2]|nr:MAG: tRNA (guanine(10)-N(2))-dimethyltransferase [Candidatus Altiarchaeales archaeon ex4484_2]
MEIKEITEGETRLLIPSKRKITKKDVVFYNPHMELNRDLSVSITRVLKPGRFCDLLSGTGARGLRVCAEGRVKHVLLNDANPNAVELIKKNAEINNLDVEITNREAGSLLAEERFDFIDVDPFGPPVAFVDSAVRALENNGVLAVTATDTSALCGTYPRACRRKYDSLSLRTDYYNEVGLRTLLGYVIRVGLGYNVSFRPLFSHCTRHYFRAYFRGERSRRACNESLKHLVYLQHCFSCLNRGYSSLDGLLERCECGHEFANAGPLWSGVFADKEFCSGVMKELGFSEKGLELVDLVRGEQDITNPYYNIHRVFHKRGMPTRPTSELIDSLLGIGFRAVRTHFSGLGLRTDAPVKEIYDIL